MAQSRRTTLESLLGSLISMVAFVVAALGTFSLFVDSERLIWIIGLFSAAFGLGARSLVADILAGTRFIFRNTFAIGEKVELSVGGSAVEGTVEEVNVTNTMLRAASQVSAIPAVAARALAPARPVTNTPLRATVCSKLQER